MRLRLLLLVAPALGLLLVAGCERPVKKQRSSVAPDAAAVLAPPAEPSPEAAKWNWTASSKDGRVSVVQTATSPKVCTVECTRDPGHESLWKESNCLGTREQVHLIMADCQHMLVIEPAPVEEGSWRAATIVTAYERATPKVQLLASDVFADDKPLMRFPQSFQWLAGGRKVPVPAPKLVDGTPDQVELVLIDGRKVVVRFDGSIVSGGRPKVAAPAPAPGPKPKVKKKPHR